MYEYTQWVDLERIVDSMQLDSDQQIACLAEDGTEVSLEVRGAVRVWWNEDGGDPGEGECYDCPSGFPDNLKKLIEENSEWQNDPRVCVSDSNWFEVFYSRGGSRVPMTDVVNVEGYSTSRLYALLSRMLYWFQTGTFKYYAYEVNKAQGGD